MSQKEKVYDYLLEAILSNQYLPGEPIIELDVAARLNTSRTPVREAFKTLEAEGLLSYYPSRGTFVSEFTAYDVEEIFSLRIALENFALQLAYQRISDSEIQAVEDLFNALDPGTSSAEEFAKADRKLHALFIDNSGNMRLKQFLKTLNVQIERFRRIAAIEPNRLKNSKLEHLDILQKLKSKDLPLIQASLTHHLNNVKESTLKTASIMGMNRWYLKNEAV